MTTHLPELCLITGSYDNIDDFANRLRGTLDKGSKLVQLKCKGLDAEQTIALAKRAASICEGYRAPLLVATDPETFRHCRGDGLHLSSGALQGVTGRPVDDGRLLSISCHTEEAMEQAVALGADLLFLSPIKPTDAHPDLDGIGWERFAVMTKDIAVPVYGLGGMGPDDLADALAAGAQGIASTRPFWP